MGYLILRGASRLDAFSVYPFPTWLPGREPGGSTGTPEVSPSPVSYTHLDVYKRQDMYHNRVVRLIEFFMPDALENFVCTEHAARVGGQQIQNIKFEP